MDGLETRKTDEIQKRRRMRNEHELDLVSRSSPKESTKQQRISGCVYKPRDRDQATGYYRGLTKGSKRRETDRSTSRKLREEKSWEGVHRRQVGPRTQENQNPTIPNNMLTSLQALSVQLHCLSQAPTKFTKSPSNGKPWVCGKLKAGIYNVVGPHLCLD